MFTIWPDLFTNDTSTIPAGFANMVRLNMSRAVDGAGGGLYTPIVQLEIGGAGLEVSANFLVSAVDATFDSNVLFNSGVGFFDEVSISDLIDMHVFGDTVWESGSNAQWSTGSTMTVETGVVLQVESGASIQLQGIRTRAVTSDPWRSLNEASWDFDSTNSCFKSQSSTGTSLWWPLNVMEGEIITSYGGWTQPPNVAGIPASKQSWAIWRRNLTSNVLTMVETSVDPVAVEGSYEAAHLFLHSGSTITVAAGYLYLLVWGGPSGDGTGGKVWTPYIVSNSGLLK